MPPPLAITEHFYAVFSFSILSEVLKNCDRVNDVDDSVKEKNSQHL